MTVQCLMLINNFALIVSGFNPSRRNFVLSRCILYSRVMFVNGPSLMKLIHDRHWLHFLPVSVCDAIFLLEPDHLDDASCLGICSSTIISCMAANLIALCCLCHSKICN
jgi:hypothetical protein